MTFSLAASALLPLALVITIWRANVAMRRDAKPRVVETLGDLVPGALVVVLGCPRQSRSGRPNRLFEARIATAAAAYHHARADDRSRLDFLCSGWDAHGEASAMADGLIEARVDPARITVDGRAARTIDSVEHVARSGPERPVVFVSQRFHLPRVLYLARAFDLDAQGLPAAGELRGFRPRLREFVAAPRARFDLFPRRRDRRLRAPD